MAFVGLRCGTSTQPCARALPALHLFLSFNAVIARSCAGWGGDGADLGFGREPGWLPRDEAGSLALPWPQGTGVPAVPQQQCGARTALLGGFWVLGWGQPGTVLLSPGAVWGVPALPQGGCARSECPRTAALQDVTPGTRPGALSVQSEVNTVF